VKMTSSNKKKVELMAPLKNLKSLNAVIGNADAVYFGVESFNMLLSHLPMNE